MIMVDSVSQNWSVIALCNILKDLWLQNRILCPHLAIFRVFLEGDTMDQKYPFQFQISLNDVL